MQIQQEGQQGEREQFRVGAVTWERLSWGWAWRHWQIEGPTGFFILAADQHPDPQVDRLCRAIAAAHAAIEEQVRTTGSENTIRSLLNVMAALQLEDEMHEVQPRGDTET